MMTILPVDTDEVVDSEIVDVVQLLGLDPWRAKLISVDQNDQAWSEELSMAEAIDRLRPDHPENGTIYKRRRIVCEPHNNHRDWDQSFVPWEKPEEEVNPWGTIV